MGLLDDAIREHLELKRRRGADPEEVGRQEREALGAPVRGEFATPSEPGADAGDQADDVAAVAASETDEELDPEEDLEPEAELDPEPEAELDPEPADEEDTWLDEELADPRGSRAAGPDEEEDAEGEDVLEETPEFLQETPEHDRLWFEQKPPRDFDWDK